ncbi:hypothetical protein ACFCYH_33220 [Streptomyces sp. NPDC056400]|uniref:hypothetical protein n=1 Tax=Streptomyces sp. NPDC056400 TaxID=3345808 RepID=UPI0035D80839
MADTDHSGSLVPTLAAAASARLGPDLLGRAATGEVIDVLRRRGLVITTPGLGAGRWRRGAAAPAEAAVASVPVFAPVGLRPPARTRGPEGAEVVRADRAGLAGRVSGWGSR